MKRTFHPSVVRRKRTHGFLVRMRTRGGRAVLRARRAKGRARLSVWALAGVTVEGSGSERPILQRCFPAGVHSSVPGSACYSEQTCSVFPG